jgi:hypothetical protein
MKLSLPLTLLVWVQTLSGSFCSVHKRAGNTMGSNIAVCFVGQFLRQAEMGNNIKKIFDHGFGTDAIYDVFISTSTQHFEEDPSILVNTSSLCSSLKVKGILTPTVFIFSLTHTSTPHHIKPSNTTHIM